jgi:hypothetical protein
VSKDRPDPNRLARWSPALQLTIAAIALIVSVIALSLSWGSEKASEANVQIVNANETRAGFAEFQFEGSTRGAIK